MLAAARRWHHSCLRQPTPSPRRVLSRLRSAWQSPASLPLPSGGLPARFRLFVPARFVYNALSRPGARGACLQSAHPTRPFSRPPSARKGWRFCDVRDSARRRLMGRPLGGAHQRFAQLRCCPYLLLIHVLLVVSCLSARDTGGRLMAQSLTISQLDPSTLEWIEREAQRTGLSPDAVVRQLIYRGLALARQQARRQRHHDLDALAG